MNDVINDEWIIPQEIDQDMSEEERDFVTELVLIRLIMAILLFLICGCLLSSHRTCHPLKIGFSTDNMVNKCFRTRSVIKRPVWV
uniref:Uncharacterized protein n=1 Tax=Caenorhabditis japonica TaxID=281687 RepID=A0A8R1E5L8_CAEJA